jgi:hypothetical protein
MNCHDLKVRPENFGLTTKFIDEIIGHHTLVM